MKIISGKDPINLRDNYTNSEDVKNIIFNFVIYIMTNSFPDVVPDEGLWKRFIFFPCDAKFTFDEKEVDESKFIYLADKDLITKFLNNQDYKSSTLNMLLETSKYYFNERFNDIPEKCKDKTEGMKLERAEDQDPITCFLNEPFVKKDNSKRIERSKFNQYVIKYSKVKYRKIFRSSDINESMRKKGFNDKKSDGIFYFEGFTIDTELLDTWTKENI